MGRLIMLYYNLWFLNKEGYSPIDQQIPYAYIRLLKTPCLHDILRLAELINQRKKHEMTSESNLPDQPNPDYVYSRLHSQEEVTFYLHPLPSLHLHEGDKCLPDLHIKSGCLVCRDDAFYFLEPGALNPKENNSKPPQKLQKGAQSPHQSHVSCTRVGEVASCVEGQECVHRFGYDKVIDSVAEFDSIYVRLNTPSIAATMSNDSCDTGIQIERVTPTIPGFFFFSMGDAAMSLHDLVERAILVPAAMKSDNTGFTFEYNADGYGYGHEEFLTGNYRALEKNIDTVPDMVFEITGRFRLPEVENISFTKDEDQVDEQSPPKSWVISTAAPEVRDPSTPYPSFEATEVKRRYEKLLENDTPSTKDDEQVYEQRPIKRKRLLEEVELLSDEDTSSTDDNEQSHGQPPSMSSVIAMTASEAPDPLIPYPWFKALGMVDDAMGYRFPTLGFRSTKQLYRIMLEESRPVGDAGTEVLD